MTLAKGTPDIIRGSDQMFNIIYEGNGSGQRVGKFVPFTDNGTIAKSCIFNRPDDPMLAYTPSGTGTNRRKYTISFWFKPSFDGSDSHERAFFFAGPYGNDDGITLKNTRKLHFWINGTVNASLLTTRTLEDSSKFYHILVAVDTTQSTASDRVKLYVDGDQITNFDTENYPSQNYDGNVSTAVQHNVGAQTGNNRQCDGYLAEVNYVDGTALTPSTFGLTDTSTGRWIPKTLTGITYGTNGFRLQFANSAGQTIGDDTSGQGNDLTVTNLAATDITTDSPTQNHSSFSPLADETTSSTCTQGNLTTTISGYGSTITNIALPTSGKYYWEFKATYTMDGNTILGVQPQNGIGFASSGQFPGGSNNPNSFGIAPAQGSSSKVQAVKGSTFTDLTLNKITTNGTFHQFCWDGDTGSLWYGYNNSFEGDPSAGTGAVFTGINDTLKILPAVFAQNGSYEVNFGQRGFEYTPPTGFVALQQDNLPENAKGVSGLVWNKNRDSSSYNHGWWDSSRGAFKFISSNTTTAEQTALNGTTKFLKGGYTVGAGGGGNNSGDSIVAWNWVANGGTTATNEVGAINSTVQVNTTAGFSIVQYTGSGGAASVGHGLSSAPEWMIFKDLGNSTAWRVYHKSIGGITKYLVLNTTAAVATASMWGTPTNSAFIIGGTGYEVNESGNNYIAYCWHSVPGFSKFGSYEGNANANGPFINLGFKPSWLMIKNIDRSVDWIIIDNKRDPINNGVSSLLKPSATSSESEANNQGIDLLSNGFKVRQSSSNAFNASGETHAYMAFAEHPFIGTSSINPITAR